MLIWWLWCLETFCQQVLFKGVETKFHPFLTEEHPEVSSKKTTSTIWVFPKIGVPQNGWFMMENPIKMDDLGGKTPYFWNHPFVKNFGNPTPGWLVAWIFVVQPPLGWEQIEKELLGGQKLQGTLTAQVRKPVGHGMGPVVRLGDSHGDSATLRFGAQNWTLAIPRVHETTWKWFLQLSYQKDLGNFLEWRLDSTERKIPWNVFWFWGSPSPGDIPAQGDLAGDAEAQLVRKIASVDHHLPEPWWFELCWSERYLKGNALILLPC